MSDFDKEAERERLREKYGDEEADREATEQMSELLLKGATMTNAHCNNCGDPIFRYDGQEFCPTCQQPVDRGEADEDADSENIEVTRPSDEATVQFGGADQQPANQQTADQHAPDAQAPDQHATADAAEEASAGDTAAAQDDRSPQDVRSPQQRGAPSPSSAEQRGQADETRTAPSLDPTGSNGPADDRGTAPRATESAAGDATGHLTNAQALLAQTVEQYARQARDADSPRQAREYLEAAREAAETLDATGY